jgi:integrase
LNLMTKTAPIRPVVADDFDPANGFDVMDFAQAQAAAGGPSRSGASFTVTDAMLHYLKTRAAQGRDITSSQRKAEAWIIDQPIGATECNDLTREQIRDWLAAIAAKSVKSKTETDPAKLASRRRATANRILTVLKSALNLCYLEKVDGRQVIATDHAWKRLSPLEDANNVRDRWLDLFEAQRFERGCVGDFRTLVKGALLSGARYGQLASAKVAQFEPMTKTLRLETRKGRSGAVHKYRVYLNAEAVALFSALCAGRRGDELIFTNDGEAWDEGEQIRLTNAACDSAGIAPRITFHGLRHTYASLALQANPPMSLLILSRNLGHKNTKRVEETYGHLAAAHILEAVNASAPSFGFTAESNVRALR